MVDPVDPLGNLPVNVVILHLEGLITILNILARYYDSLIGGEDGVGDEAGEEDGCEDQDAQALLHDHERKLHQVVAKGIG